MNRVEITVRGPIMEDLAGITVADHFQEDQFCVDYADIRDYPNPHDIQCGVLEIIFNNGGPAAIDILQAAITNGSPVYIDGENVPDNVLRSVFNSPKP